MYVVEDVATSINIHNALCLITRSCFQLSSETLKVAMKLFANNRKRLCQKLKDNKTLQPNSVIVLEGGRQTARYCTDTDIVFRQVRE